MIVSSSSKFRLLDCPELWRYRHLLVMLVIRDVVGKYRQSVLGVAWAIILPLTQTATVVLTLGKIADLGPSGHKYGLFVFIALVPWNYFTRALQNSGQSLLNNQTLLTKVYFPRLILPLSGVIAALLDFAICLAILVAWLMISSTGLSPRLLAIPVIILYTSFVAISLGLWTTTLSIKYRDIAFILPACIQLGLFITPVMFSLDKLAVDQRSFFWLNPLCSVVEAFRWAILPDYPTPPLRFVLVSITATAVVLLSGLVLFRRMETTIVDII